MINCKINIFSVNVYIYYLVFKWTQKNKKKYENSNKKTIMNSSFMKFMN